MRYHQIMSEKIVTQPHNRAAYLTTRIKALRAFSQQAGQARDAIKALDRKGEGDYLLRYALGTVMGDRPNLPNDYQIDLGRHYHLDDLAQNLESIVKFGPDQFLRYAMGTLDIIKPLDQETRGILALMSRVEEGFAEYGFTSDQQDDEYRAARSWADAYVVIADILPKIEAIIAQLNAMFADLVKRNNHNHEPHRYRPDHNPVEVLYHTTMYANQIIRDGFLAEKPDGRQGLGNFGDQSQISFTHDLKIAHDIMRGLKEMWMIVHGEIKRSTILGWMKVEKIDPVKAASYFSSAREDPQSVGQVIALHRAYLALSKIRTDPTFVSPENLIPALQACKLKDIGIISCEVQLDDVASYHHGEREFRVPAGNVVGEIKRVI